MAEDFQAFAHKAVHLKSAEAQLRAERIEIVKGKLKLQSQRDKVDEGLANILQQQGARTLPELAEPLLMLILGFDGR